MNWLWSNKEWVFSGIGVVFLGLLIRIFFGPRAAGHSSIVSADRNSSVLGSPVASGSNISQTVSIVLSGGGGAPPQTKIPYAATPSPKEIRAQLNALPLFQRKAATQSYLGLNVRWPVTLEYLSEIGEWHRKEFKTDFTHTLEVNFENYEGLVRTEVNIERFPRLKISHKGSRMQISGTVSNVSEGGTVTLRDANITFDE
jgi:hypothetical protein